MRRELREAWRDSLALGAEIGGFILEAKDGSLLVVRWLPGSLDSVEVPDHSGCQYAGLNIRATFHTHPSSDMGSEQEPSDIDLEEIRNDPDLKAEWYEGEYVLSTQQIYLVSQIGTYSDVGERKNLLL